MLSVKLISKLDVKYQGHEHHSLQWFSCLCSRPVLTQAQACNFRWDCCEKSCAKLLLGPNPFAWELYLSWDTCPWSLTELRCSYSSARPRASLVWTLPLTNWFDFAAWSQTCFITTDFPGDHWAAGWPCVLSLNPVLSLTWLSGLDLGPTSLPPTCQLVPLNGPALLFLFGYCGTALLAGEISTPACLAVTCSSWLVFP